MLRTLRTLSSPLQSDNKDTHVPDMLSAPPSPGPLPSLLAEPSLAPRPTPLGTLLPPIGALSLAVCLGVCASHGAI